jgi:transposase
MILKDEYKQFFLNPQASRHKHYEMLRYRFVDGLPVKEIARKFSVSFYTIESRIRDFKKSIGKGKPSKFFYEPAPGPKKDRKKPLVREDIIRLRKRGYASTDIYKALDVAGFKVSLSLIDQVLREKGVTGLKRRTKEDRERVSEEINTGKIPGLTIKEPVVPEVPAVTDVRSLDLSEGRAIMSRVAGIFLFLPLLVQLGFHEIVKKAKMAGTTMIPAVSYLLSLLTLKLLDKERKSHISDWNFDKGLGLFAGLNVLPKTVAITDYSYRLLNSQHNDLLAAWVGEMYPILCPVSSQAFALDFHPIPYRGEDSHLERHYVPARGKALPSILTFFARAVDSPMLCYANADIIREEQTLMSLKFVEYWKTITGVKPDWLYFDSKLTTYEGLSHLNEQGINFITIRRKGKKMIGNIFARSHTEWTSALIDTPQRKHQRVKYLEDRVKLRNYKGLCRQIAVTGLGRTTPTLFLTNNEKITGREAIIRYIKRNSIENDLGINVNFFHLDCLSSEVRLNVNLDVVFTAIANGCYRWLSQKLKGCEKMKPKQIYRKFVETSGDILIKENNIFVRLERRSHNPIIAQAELDKNPILIPWLNGKQLKFDFK